MFKVPVPDTKRKETEALVKSDKYSKESLADNLPLRNRPSEGTEKSDQKATEKEEK